MYVPIIPFVRNTTVINNIVYSDTVLPLKDNGSNLKVTSISNVEEFSLEKCLKIILESNPNVVFNTIQYSKNDKKVYFYTDAEISKKAWEDNKVITYKPLTSSSEILEEVERVLLIEKNKDDDCISSYNIAQLMKNKEYQYENMKESYQQYLNDIIKNNYYRAFISIRDFDYDEGELEIGFSYITDDFEAIRFAKRNGDLYISKSESVYSKDILVALGDTLSELYDKFIEYRGFRTQSNYYFKSVNSSFLIDVDRYGVSILNKILWNFKLSSCSYQNEWMYDCNSNIIINSLQGKECEIFKKIFVKISDCPEWTQPILYEIRKNQLEKERNLEEQRLLEKQRIEEEIKRREEKKQKRLELTRKIFPFLKK